MKTNLEWFRTFKAIYETGTLTGASKSLSMSQPGVSLHLNSLEVYTGYPLFERKAKKMLPTEKGTILYSQVAHLLGCLENVEDLLHKKSGKNRATLSVGMCIETFEHDLEQFVPTLPFNLIMRFENSEQLKQLFDLGILDLALVHKKGNEKEVSYHFFRTEKLVLVSGKDTDTAVLEQYLQHNQLDAAKHWLEEQVWYGTAADTEQIHRFWEALFGETPHFLPNYIVPNKFSIIRCLAEGGGFSILPDYLCLNQKYNQGIKIIETPKSAENQLFFCRKKRSMYDTEMDTVISLLEQQTLSSTITSFEQQQA
ncbi:LysR family transcriptional regulator [Taibaiella sp. KBW10]|uniref:LysR family transcriptional regulator n=1 Tax=Taibaiella sp. KBW10 TaxID=2153357 RepID=UPI000F5A3BF8|nr:LysR family transcriptional regulator [Taibaiella sp. KBW10]RQO32237.1 LysR family transcriptional regulator [Taibaiella sp. KBW10]